MENINIEDLKERIKKSNLSENDKNILLKKLQKKEPDILACTIAFIKLLDLGTDILDRFL